MKNWLVDHWLWVLVVSVSLSVSWPLFAPGYFSHHDDLQVLRVYEIRQCIQDFQLPCRWSKNLGYGNGFPVYNYYGVFPYYIGGLLSFVFGYVLSAKILFFIATFGAAISMWLCSRELFGKYPGLVATTLYVYAPYRALDIYVRGALAEAWSIALIPLVMYSILKLSRESKQRWFLLTVFSLFGLFSSHNIMTIFFGPVLALWILWCGWNSKGSFFRLWIGFGLGVCISSFFLLPAFLEKGLIQNETLTRFDLDFRVHFVSVNQLFFSRFWGYGASVEGPWDGISFQIGWPHWWFVLAGMGIIIWNFFRKRVSTNAKMISLIFGLIIIFWLSIFMTHNKSAFVWESISILQFAQFPWRFLAVSILTASLISGGVMYFVRSWQKPIAIGVIIFTVIFNIGFFHPDKYYFGVTDANKLSGEEWDRQTSSIILDYLPKTAFEPSEKAPNGPLVTNGEASVSGYIHKSNSFKFNLKTVKGAKIEMPIFYFPGWMLKINGHEVAIKHDNLLGRISFDVSEGEYEVLGYFGDTPVRGASNMISLVGLGCILGYLKYAKNKRIRF